jgi:hypothetical protein
MWCHLKRIDHAIPAADVVEVTLGELPKDRASSSSASRCRVALRSRRRCSDGRSHTRRCFHMASPEGRTIVSTSSVAPRHRRVCVALGPVGPCSPPTRAVSPRHTLQRHTKTGVNKPEGSSTHHTVRCSVADSDALRRASPVESRRSRCPEGCRSRRRAPRFRETRCNGARPRPTSSPLGRFSRIRCAAHRNSLRRVKGRFQPLGTGLAFKTPHVSTRRSQLDALSRLRAPTRR